MNELEISSTVSQALTDNGHPPIFCLGIFNGGERLFEGVIVNGEKVNEGPVLKFTYDWIVIENHVSVNITHFTTFTHILPLNRHNELKSS